MLRRTLLSSLSLGRTLPHPWYQTPLCRFVSVKKFTKSHEWIESDDGIGTCGLTDVAQDKLGEIVFVSLPTVGSEFKVGEEVAEVESVKSCANLFASFDGSVVEVNSKLEDDPSEINKAAESSGWLVKMSIDNAAQLESLMSPEEYKTFCDNEDN